MLSTRLELGRGLHGCLSLILRAVKYLQIKGNAFKSYPNLGPLPTFPEAPTQPQIALRSAKHKEELRLWKEQEIVKITIKNQLINAFDYRCIADLHGNVTGYNNFTIQQLFEHLYENYGDLYENDLEVVEKELM